MVKYLLITLLTLELLAGSIDSKVARIVGQDRYYNNETVIQTLFSNPNRYITNGRIDLEKVTTLLERTGILAKKFPAKKEQEFLFTASQKPYLFLKLSEMALVKGNVFRYGIDDLTRAKQIKVRYIFESSQEPTLSKMIAFFKSLNVRVVDLYRSKSGWHIVLDLNSARFPAQKATGKLQGSSKGIWVWVCGKKRVALRNSRIWYPSIALYDESLTPLDVVQKREGTRAISFALPNDTCYIKISDIFTSKNIKTGLKITAY